MPDLEINADLGEGEPMARTEALFRFIDSASIACGGHAGTEDSMRDCLRLARRHGVRPGAHPGIADRAEFGRRLSRAITPAELESILHEQVGRLSRLASDEGPPLHHVKLHGALYHAVEGDPALARCYLETVAARWPGLCIYARAGGRIVSMTGYPVEVWPEAFLERGILDDGSLVPRGSPGALMASSEQVVARFLDLRDRGGCLSVSEKWVPLRARTACIHGDLPGAVDMLAAIRAVAPRDRS